MDWNDHFRDAVRSFWLADRAAIDAGGQGGSVARLADALSGSAGLFEPSGRSRLASLNFITAHDGFTLADLVSYDRKHNEANGEQNRDGHGDNRSYNHGFEGPTEDEDILARRAQTSRNLMASLMISLGVPMITAGRRDRPDPAGQQQRLLPGQPHHLDRLDQHPGIPCDAAHHQARHPAAQGIPGRPAARLPGARQAVLLPLVRCETASRCPGTRWHDPRHRVVQLLLGSDDGHVDGLVVVNGGAEDVKVTLPQLSNEDGTGQPALRTAPDHLRTP